MTVSHHSDINVFIGLDVGKQFHHACALDANGTKLYDKQLPQQEAALVTVIEHLQQHGPVLLVVDQPNTIGALPVAVARACGCTVAYLPGLAMRNAADLYPGNTKTDRRDAFIIADTARTMPHTLRAVDRDNEVLSALKMIAGFDEDIAHDCTRSINRLRSVLTQIYPSLERVFTGQRFTRVVVLDLLIHYKGPEGLKRAGYHRVLTWLRAHATIDPAGLCDEIFAALNAQTATVPGADAAEFVIPQRAATIKALKQQRDSLAEQVEQMVAQFPLSEVLMSMPGVGITTACQILLAVGDCSDFPTAGHLAAYAGIAPTTRRSATSIRGEFPARAGNKRLKNALFYSAFAAIRSHTVSRDYYDRKRVEGKRHNAALMCLARRRCNVTYAMLRKKECFREIPPTPTPLAA